MQRSSTCVYPTSDIKENRRELLKEGSLQIIHRHREGKNKCAFAAHIEAQPDLSATQHFITRKGPRVKKAKSQNFKGPKDIALRIRFRLHQCGGDVKKAHYSFLTPFENAVLFGRVPINSAPMQY